MSPPPTHDGLPIHPAIVRRKCGAGGRAQPGGDLSRHTVAPRPQQDAVPGSLSSGTDVARIFPVEKRRFDSRTLTRERIMNAVGRTG